MRVNRSPVIYKYHLTPENKIQGDDDYEMIKHRMRIPRGFKILKCGMQNEKITLWIIHDITMESVDLDIIVFGTGWDLPPPDKDVGFHFLNTVFDGDLVWHVFVKFEMQDVLKDFPNLEEALKKHIHEKLDGEDVEDDD